MSVNVGSISARFGLDSADFLEKLRGATGATELFSNQMKREMNQASREGAESLHLLDHALGIELPRSMNRLLTREFPAFAEGLQSLLGVGAVGVLVEAGAQFGEKIAQHIEKAKKAEQDFDEALRHTQDVIGDLGASHARTMKEIELRMAEQAGKPGAKTAAVDFKIDTAALDKAKKQVAEITEAMEKEAKAAEIAGKWTTQFWASVGYVADNFFSTSSREADAAGAKFKNFKLTLDELLQAHSVDPLQGLRDSLKKTSDELSTTGLDIARKMAAIQAAEAFGNMPGHVGAQAKAQLTAGISPEALETEKRYFELLKQEQKLLADILTEDQGHRRIASADDSRERELKAMQALAALQHDIAGGTGKLLPEIDPIKKLATEISGFRMAAENDFRDVAASAASALDMRAAKAALDQYEHRLDDVMIKARRDADVVAAAAKLPSAIAPTGAAPVFSTRSAMPTLGAGGLAGAQFDTFAKDDVAKTQLAKQVYEQALTPLDKYKLGVRELDQLVHDHLIDDTARAAGMAELDRQMVKAADSAHKMAEEMQKLLERSNDAAAGVKAFGMQLQINAAENGKFAYDVLTASTKGAEDDAAKSLMMILEEQRGGHRKLIHDLEAMWSSYFNNLAMMGLKHGMDQLLGPVGKAITGGIGGSAQAVAEAANTSALTAATVADTANTAAGVANTTALAANTAALLLMSRMQSGGGPGGLLGGPASSGGGGFPFEFIPGESLGVLPPFMASGGDATPGSSFISGEAGAERVDLGSRGGAHITPLGVAGAGGDIHIYQDFTGALVTEDLMRRSEAAHAIAASEGRMMSALPTKQREINLRKR